MRTLVHEFVADHITWQSEWLNRFFIVALVLLAIGLAWVVKEHSSRYYSKQLQKVETEHARLINEANRMEMELASRIEYTTIVNRAQDELGMVFLEELPDTVFVSVN